MSKLPKKRVFWVMIDSVGVGYMPDAQKFTQVPGGDVGANTLYHIIEITGGLEAPYLQRLGLANTLVSKDHPEGNLQWKPIDSPLASFGRMAEMSVGKDTPSGHWEMAGCVVPYQMCVYPQGLPQEMLDKFVSCVRSKGIDLPGVIGGQPASGTEIIKELGEESLQTGKPIIYTSGDSVFQIAAHEEVFGLEKLYEICVIAREMLNEYEDKIGRVIARPFVGDNSQTFTRTPHRRDYSVKPLKPTVLDAAKVAGFDVISIGKIADIFANEGITEKVISKSNTQGMEEITALAKQEDWQGIAFVNLSEFDTLYGHRRNPQGYRKALEDLDRQIPALLSSLKEEDLLIMAADHGCDPTFAGFNHTREYVPVLVYQKGRESRDLGTRKSFADVAATVSNFLGLNYESQAESLL